MTSPHSPNHIFKPNSNTSINNYPTDNNISNKSKTSNSLNSKRKLNQIMTSNNNNYNNTGKKRFNNSGDTILRITGNNNYNNYQSNNFDDDFYEEVDFKSERDSDAVASAMGRINFQAKVDGFVGVTFSEEIGRLCRKLFHVGKADEFFELYLKHFGKSLEEFEELRRSCFMEVANVSGLIQAFSVTEEGFKSVEAFLKFYQLDDNSKHEAGKVLKACKSLIPSQDLLANIGQKALELACTRAVDNSFVDESSAIRRTIVTRILGKTQLLSTCDDLGIADHLLIMKTAQLTQDNAGRLIPQFSLTAFYSLIGAIFQYSIPNQGATDGFIFVEQFFFRLFNNKLFGAIRVELDEERCQDSLPTSESYTAHLSQDLVVLNEENSTRGREEKGEGPIRRTKKDGKSPTVENSLPLPPVVHHKNHVQLVNELSAKYYKKAPEYKQLAEEGPPHNPIFKIGIYIEGNLVSKGEGNSKKVAKEVAAADLYPKLVAMVEKVQTGKT